MQVAAYTSTIHYCITEAMAVAGLSSASQGASDRNESEDGSESGETAKNTAAKRAANSVYSPTGLDHTLTLY
jgi:hypothetical protein